MQTCSLAVTIHDPGGNFLPGFERARDQLTSIFPGGAAAVTSLTSASVKSFVEARLGWRTVVVEPDGQVGLHRRMALELALAAGPDGVIYSDADHILRWVEACPEEVESVASGTEDFVVVGRSPAAMDASPARLRDTERVINHIYSLMAGDSADVMFAVRRLSNAAATHIVKHAQEPSIGNDVEWPLLARDAGYDVKYFASEHLAYRTREDFDTEFDDRDSDPRQWIARVEIANVHAQVLRRFL